MELLHDATVWVLISFLIFVGLAWRFAKAGLLGKLDGRIAEIKKEIAEAESLRLEAQELLALYQRKHRDAAKEAAEIVASARKHADKIAKEAQKEIEETIARREQQLKERLRRMEETAIAEIKAHAAALAVKATAEIISDKLDQAANDRLVTQTITQLGGRLG